tara:strand:+ start:121 stop:579 length:459 start_codon:yes stop_codon:yes gene_type:complete
MTRKAQLGSVSSATMRPQDLIPRFLDELRDLAGDAKVDTLVMEYDVPAGLDDALQDDNHPYWGSEEPEGLLEVLFDELDEHAPPHCYFGAHEGDGADYGFWISWDSLDDDPDVLRCDDGRGGVALPDYILHTNDHGNVTLYKVTLTPAWDCV